ncbi:uncharacterized protein [Argopecten irradians]|uniref:uncharacterized protein isoform X1 n=1 Tax=Argopecten irradians TaxID=31199 RepID=UPI00371CD749
MASPAHLFVLGLVLSVIPGGLCYDLMPKPKECKNKIGDKKCQDLFNNKYNGKTYDMCFSYNGFDDCCAFCVDRLVCVNGNQNDLSDLKVKYMYLTVECKDTMKYSQCQNIYDNVYKKDTKAMCEDKKYSKMCCTFCRSGVGKAWNNRLIDEWIKHPYSAVDYFLGGKNDYNGYGKYDKYDDRMDRSYNALGYDSYDDGDDSYIKDIFDGFDDGYRDDTGYNDNRNKEYGYDGYDDKIDDYIKNMFKGFGYDDKDDCGNSTGDYGYEDYENKVYDYIKDMLGGFDFDGKGNYDDKSYGYGDENGKGNYDDKSYGYGDKNGKGVYGGKYYDRYGKSKYDDKRYVYGNEIGKGGYNGNSYRGYDGKGGYNGNVYRGYNDKNGYNDNDYRGYDDKSGYNGNDYRGYDGGYMDLKRLLDEFRYGGDYVKGLMDKLGMGNLNGLFGNDDYYNKFMKNAFKGSGYDGKKEYLRGNLASNDAGKTNKMDKISRRRRREVEGDGVCKDSLGKDNCRMMMMNKYTVHGGMPHIFCANPHNMVSCCRFCTTALADGEENRKRRSLAFQGKSEYPADGESEPCNGDSLGPGKCNQIVYSIFKGNKAGMCSTVHYGNVCCQSCRRYATSIA